MPAASVSDGAVALTVGAERVPPAPLPPPTGAEADLPENPIPTPQLLAAQHAGRHIWSCTPMPTTVPCRCWRWATSTNPSRRRT